MSMDQQVKALLRFRKDFLDGKFIMPTALGPNQLSKNAIKAKSITGHMISVSDLEAVNTNTGDLSITGNLTMSTSGAIRAGKTAYSDTINAGYWLGVDGGTPKFRIGSSSQSIVWDGTTLSITGTLTATTGTIGGWTIGTTDITADSGATGMASSGSYRFWSGHATPSLAEFSVSSAGALVATAGSIGGWTINGVTGIQLGSGASQRGMDTGSTAFYAGSSTPSSAPFRVSTAGALVATTAAIGPGTVTVQGGITATSLVITGTASFSGGTMTLPNGGSITSSTVDLNQGTLSGLTVDGNITIGSGGKIQWDSNNSYIDDVGIVVNVGSSEAPAVHVRRSGFNPIFRLVAAVPNGNDVSGGIVANSISTNRAASVKTSATNADNTTLVDAQAIDSGGSVASRLRLTGDGYVIFNLGSTDGTDVFEIRSSADSSVLFGVSSNGALVREITNDSTALGSYHGRVPIYINGVQKYLAVYNA